MNLIDLREFEFEIDKIIPLNNSEFLFWDTEGESGIYRRYLYKYIVEDNSFHKINVQGIETSEYATYSSCVIDDYVYTNAYKEHGNTADTFVYSINLINGETENVYNTKREVEANVLSPRYVLLRGSDFEIDDEHTDIQKDIRGEYDYTILCDLEEKKEYRINDKRVVLGVRDYFVPYSVDGNRFIVFEEAYMEDWELEDSFKEGIKKEAFYREGYRESINIISLVDFAEAVKKQYEVIPFYEIHKTELVGWTRYFGMDKERIYYRVKNFETQVEDIYSIQKKTLEKGLIKSIKLEGNDNSNKYYYLHHDLVNRDIYEIKEIEDNKRIVREVNNYNISFILDNKRENIDTILGDYIITNFWTEDENGENYKEFVKIKNIKDGHIDVYEGTSIIVDDSLILFK